ncbi:hypothetical protein HQ533_03955 [Candidatus Woesearchaeota archaeon]|nr:hypothetical protein [Candidatus Woesearchaeota archaeon]
MGKHYQVLMEKVNNGFFKDDVMTNGMNFHEYLCDLVNRAQLVEIPFISADLPVHLGLTKKEFFSLGNDFLELSKKNNTGILTPYKTTAIEDPQSVVIMDERDVNRFFMTTSQYLDFGRESEDMLAISCGQISVVGCTHTGILMTAKPFYIHLDIDGKKQELNLRLRAVSVQNMSESGITFIEQATYLNSYSKKEKN